MIEDLGDRDEAEGGATPSPAGRPRPVPSARLLLVASAVLFGSTFAPGQIALEHLTPGGLVLFRFGIATLVSFPLAVRHLGEVRSRRAAYAKAGLIAGVVNTVGFLVLSAALQRTTASNTAFLSSLFVVIVPTLAALLARRMPRPPVLVGIALAVAGSFLLSGADLAIGLGDALAVADAFVASAHILAVAHFAPRLRALPFNLAQLLVAALAVVPVAVVGGVGRLAAGAVVAAVWCGVAQGAALGLQVAAQRSVDSTSSALILLLVPVSGAALGYVLVDDRLGAVGLVGAGLIVAAVLVAEVVPSWRARRARRALVAAAART